MIPPDPPLRLAVDSAALAGNYRALGALSGKARAGAAVKANAYGVGLPVVVPVLANAGCESFFVAHWGEAAAIIGLVDPSRVSVLHGPLNAQDAAYARAIGAKPVINSVNQARLWQEAGGGLCDLMVDTGINRLGLPMAALGDSHVRQLDVDILMSHLASADEDSALNAAQQQRWASLPAEIKARRISLANSAGIGLGAAYHGDLTRPGLSLYGGVPRPELAQHIRQVVQPQVAIMQLRQLCAGESIGYNETFMATAAMRVGVVALGYADGYLRCWSGKGCLHYEGQPLPVLGRVSMDMTVIDVSAAPHIAEGDWVDVDYDLPQSAAISGLSQYELLTLLGQRFGRPAG